MSSYTDRHRKFYRKNRLDILSKKKLEWKEKLAGSRILRIYGLTTEDVVNLTKKQEGRCAICKKENKRLVIDHDHASGSVRGLLCNSCNHLLGNAKDSILVLKQAIKYLVTNSR